MRNEEQEFVLTTSRRGECPVLVGVAAHGRLDGVLFDLTLRQTYRNTSGRNLEVFYTFPLPQDAVLLGFATELDDKRMQGVVLARKEAEQQYEQALPDGDAPVMLEALGGGLHTANIGNLLPGQEVVLEVRYAQLLRFEQGRLRLRIPTTIAPRYGQPADAGLQPQQVPVVSLTVEYPLSLAIDIAGTLARAQVECVSHPMRHMGGEGSLQRLELGAGARLDRDVVVVVTPTDALPSVLLRAQDEVDAAAPTVLMAAIQPPMGAARDRLNLRLLVDCSGSMAGDSMASARRAMLGVLAELGEADTVSFSRFGTTVEHLQAPTAATPRALRLLQRQVESAAADLGGTEIEKALQEVVALGPQPSEQEALAADILLITDGQVWQADSLIGAARAGGHRIFAIGVGAAPAEGVLRNLAEATGGACEFAVPGEALEQAAQRMMVRLRQQPWRNVRIDWGVPVQWQTPMPALVYGADTLIAFAGTAVNEPRAATLLAPASPGSPAIEVARAESTGQLEVAALARMAAAQRLDRVDDIQARELALRYQLLSKHTHCVMVHRRADGAKAVDTAELVRVESMLAAGWGGMGSTTGQVLYSASQVTSLELACVNRMGSAGHHLQAADTLVPLRGARSAMPRLSTRTQGAPRSDNALPERSSDCATLREVVQWVGEPLDVGDSAQDLAGWCSILQCHPDLEAALSELRALGLPDAEVWLVLVQWILSRHPDLGDSVMSPEAQANLQTRLGSVDAALLGRAQDALQRLLGGVDLDSWDSGRTRRLRAALARGPA